MQLMLRETFFFILISKNAYDLKDLYCEANPAGENSSFIFTVCVKSVPLYHFKLAYIQLSKNVSKPTSKNKQIGHYNLENHFGPTLKSVAVYC